MRLGQYMATPVSKQLLSSSLIALERGTEACKE